MTPSNIIIGRFYTNRTETMVREALEFITLPEQKNQNGIKYRVVKSHLRRAANSPYSVGFIGVCTVELFAKWAMIDVTPQWKGIS